MSAKIRIGIDTGGTFTDLVAVDERAGRQVTTKTPSTPEDPAVGFMDAVAAALDLLDAGGSEVGAVTHGTTVATNALLEGRIGDLGFVTTQGFRYVLEIARQSVPDGYGNSYFWVKPERIVPVHRIREVGGRLDVTGAEVRPFDEDSAVAAARWFRAQGIACVGVCFLHAYANPEHEQRMRAVLAAEHPDCVVSLSSDVLREYREYERSVTTLVDAAVKPRVTRYIRGIAGRLRERAGDAPFMVMKSNGGVASAEEVIHQPITTVLSGPAAGALGAAHVASAVGHERVLTLDGGGTSTDVSVVLGGHPTLTTEGRVGHFPSKIPMIDVATVGAGGGSVAWIAREGNLKVGPRSAGADPGPLCYGKGGAEPTVTDAHALLGRIPPHLLGGRMPLEVDAARRGFERLAADLGLALEEAATGVLEVNAWNQANAIRQITVKRGLDVRDFTLTAFGGSGPLSACRLVDVLGVAATLIPPNPGNLSAFGLLAVDVKNDYVQTRVEQHGDLDLDAVAAVYAALEGAAAEALAREGFEADQRRFVRSADLRYYGQAFEVRVAAPSGPVDARFAEAVLAAFHDEHERLYGYCYRDLRSASGASAGTQVADSGGRASGRGGRVPSGQHPEHAVEWVNLRVTGVGPIRTPDLPRLPAGDGDPATAATGSRRAYFDAWIDTPTYDRAKLRAGDQLRGPAVLEEFGSTIPLHPGFDARVDELGNVVITRD